MTPYSPDSPDVTEVSDTEALLRWNQPKNNGNSPIICYNVQYKETCKLFSIVVLFSLKYVFLSTDVLEKAATSTTMLNIIEPT